MIDKDKITAKEFFDKQVEWMLVETDMEEKLYDIFLSFGREVDNFSFDYYDFSVEIDTKDMRPITDEEAKAVGEIGFNIIFFMGRASCMGRGLRKYNRKEE